MFLGDGFKEKETSEEHQRSNTNQVSESRGTEIIRSADQDEPGDQSAEQDRILQKAVSRGSERFASAAGAKRTAAEGEKR